MVKTGAPSLEIPGNIHCCELSFNFCRDAKVREEDCQESPVWLSFAECALQCMVVILEISKHCLRYEGFLRRFADISQFLA